MFDEQKTLVTGFKEMPVLLKFLTVHALACFLFIIAALVPAIPFSFNGEVISITEIWSSGIGIFTVYISLVMPFCAWLMLNRKAYSRIIYLLVLSSVMIGPYVYWKEKVGVIFGVIFVSLVTVYMYGMPSVRKYFASKNV